MKNRSEIMRVKEEPSAIAPASETITAFPERTHVASDGIGQDRNMIMSEPFILPERSIERRLALRESELDHLEELICRIVSQRKSFQTQWVLWAGIAATSGFSLLGNLAVTNVPVIVWVIGLVAFVTSLILGITFRFLDVEEADKVSGSKEEVLNEIRRLRSLFHDLEDPPHES